MGKRMQHCIQGENKAKAICDPGSSAICKHGMELSKHFWCSQACFSFRKRKVPFFHWKLIQAKNSTHMASLSEANLWAEPTIPEHFQMSGLPNASRKRIQFSTEVTHLWRCREFAPPNCRQMFLTSLKKPCLEVMIGSREHKRKQFFKLLVIQKPIAAKFYKKETPKISANTMIRKEALDTIITTFINQRCTRTPHCLCGSNTWPPYQLPVKNRYFVWMECRTVSKYSGLDALKRWLV